MKESQAKIIERQLNALDVTKWRGEFTVLAAKAGVHWRRKLISKYPELYDSANGVVILNNVGKGAGGLKNTAMVVECLKASVNEDTDLIKRQKLVIPEPVEAD